MLERTTIYVDTSYLLASFYNSWEEGAREQLEVSLSTVVQTLDQIARKQSKQPTHRQFWYDGVPDSGPHRYQRTLRVIDGVILRTGQLIEWGNRRSQKAVDTRLVADMVLAAHRGQCTDMVLVSGDADMIPGVEAAIEAGVRVHLVGFGWDSVSSALRNACDTSLVLDPRTDFAESMQIRVLEGPLPPHVRGHRSAQSGHSGEAQTQAQAQAHGAGPEGSSVDIEDVDFQPGRARDESVAGAHERRRARAEARAESEPESAADTEAEGTAENAAEGPSGTRKSGSGEGKGEPDSTSGDPAGDAGAEGATKGGTEAEGRASGGEREARDDNSGAGAEATDSGTADANGEPGGSTTAAAGRRGTGAEKRGATGEFPGASPGGSSEVDTREASRPANDVAGPVAVAAAGGGAESAELVEPDEGPAGEAGGPESGNSGVIHGEEQVATGQSATGTATEDTTAGTGQPSRARGRSTVTVTHRSVTITARAERRAYGDGRDAGTGVDDENEDGSSPRPNPSMMAPRRRPVRSRYVPLTEEVWSSSGDPSPFDVGQQYATWWYQNAADEEQKLRAHTLTGGALPPEIDRPLLQFACQMLHEFTLNEFQRVALRDGFHEGIRGIVMQK